MKTPRFHGLGWSCDSPAGGRFIVLSLYFVVIKPQLYAACAICRFLMSVEAAHGSTWSFSVLYIPAVVVYLVGSLPCFTIVLCSYGQIFSLCGCLSCLVPQKAYG